jgi:hypothetical protein
MHSLVVPRMTEVANPVIAFPESPPDAFRQRRIDRRDHLGIPLRPIRYRLVVRRPRQPGYLASANNRQTMLLGQDPDCFAFG